MPDLKISQLTAGSLAQAGDEIPIARSGANYKITGADIAAAATSVGTLTSLTVSGDLTVDTSTLKVDSANNRVGIGTASPAALAHLSRTDTAAIALVSGTTKGVRIGTDATGGNIEGVDSTGFSSFEPLSLNGSILSFKTGSTERMRLDASGNLGIGTASPAYPLHVERSSYGMTGYFFANDGTRNPRLAIYGSSSGTTIQHTFSTGADALMFAVGGAIGSGSEKMRLDASGNLGLGVTPSAWTAFTAMQVGHGALASTAVGNHNVSLAANAYYDGSNWKYIGTNFATEYRQNGGSHQWFSAASGTAGNAITFTQAMTLDAGGVLTVGYGGTSSQDAAIDLDAGSASGGEAYMRLRRNSTTQFLLATDGSTSDVRGVANIPLTFWTNNAERARITAGGLFGVGSYGTITYQAEIVAPSGADRDILLAGVSGATNGLTVKWNNASSKTYVNIANIPTSSAGLPAGTLYSDAGTIKIA